MKIKINKDEKKDFEKLDQIINQYKDEKGMLINILQKSQEHFGYLPEKIQTYISQELDIPVSTINGVVSFYSLFSQKPQGKYTIGVCLGTACYVKGAQDILDTIKEELHIDVNETTMDKLFTLKSTRCIGACGLAPVITINDEVHGRVSPADVPSILYKYLKEHKDSNTLN